MGWILMQPADDPTSIAATKTLLSGGKCLFDLTKSGARLQPISFGSRACTGLERRYHSFVGEAACGRWAISQNKLYLWGSHFYWMCDCVAVKEALEYDGNISMVCRWAQELLGYHFTVLHRSKHMMRDVDALTRRFGPLVAQYRLFVWAWNRHHSSRALLTRRYPQRHIAGSESPQSSNRDLWLYGLI